MAQITIAEGDITQQDVDVIVNAANAQLAHGGGVAAAIARAGAPVVDAESRAWVAEHGPIGPGVAAITGAGGMPSGHVVHVVGPIYRHGQDNEGLLALAVRAALDASVGMGAASVAMPAISAGIYGYPPAEACEVIVRAVVTWFADGGELDEVRLVAYDAAMADHFHTALRAQGS
jgi:O-acetyl-ADP-ribose deacetylase (regulator of RNase III)